MSQHLELTDYRRRVFALYEALRRDGRPEPDRLLTFRSQRDRLFREHPQSAVPADDRAAFRGVRYYEHQPKLRFTPRLEPDREAPSLELPRSASGEMGFRRIGSVSFTIDGTACRLAAYWVEGYAGGLFIPFRDATSGTETYGGGRYVWDSIKGADLGSDGETLVLDFNYAYHPSCVYDARWSCPLAPRENWLTVPIRAGERLPAGWESHG
ncbi:MAG: DUF1684 domain-containing protein [Chloroflexota bacterium]|nr:DUF1684 domain-containing protein [Chloroflexota bacterium]